MKKILYLSFTAMMLGGCNQNADNNIQEAVQENQSITEEDLIGAWQTEHTTDEGEQVKIVAIVTDGYVSDAVYSLDNKKFIGTYGGSWELQDTLFVETYEYHTLDTSKVGTTETAAIIYRNDTIRFPGSDNVWTRIDNGEPGALEGAWLITGRKQDGEVSRRELGARKTMKILSGERFQWIAYNSETGEFFGTGGGTYTTGDSSYVENIEFFSRDSSRVGASLSFNYKLDSGEWHHTGLSSKGEPIYEIWTPRTMIDD